TARRASAQFNNASIGTTAQVVTVGMTITTLRNLNFGSVPKGVATTVLPTAAGAGEWQVDGNKNAFATITFTLPTLLNNIQAAPAPARRAGPFGAETTRPRAAVGRAALRAAPTEPERLFHPAPQMVSVGGEIDTGARFSAGDATSDSEPVIVELQIGRIGSR